MSRSVTSTHENMKSSDKILNDIILESNISKEFKLIALYTCNEKSDDRLANVLKTYDHKRRTYYDTCYHRSHIIMDGTIAYLAYVNNFKHI